MTGREIWVGLCKSASVGQQALEAPARGLDPTGAGYCRREQTAAAGNKSWLFKGRRWLRDHCRLVMPETTSKTNGRCHGDGDSHKDAHWVSLVLLSTDPVG